MNNEILIYLITLTLPLIKTKKNPKRMNLKKKKITISNEFCRE